MSTTRPQISPLLLAEMIELMPGRVRKRLDAEPDVAQRWQWTHSQDRWLVAAGEETVELRDEDGVISIQQHLRCSCLLTPKCFHVVACISVLSTPAAGVSAEISAETEIEHSAHAEPVSETQVDVTDAMRSAADQAHTAIAAVLRVGGSRAGLLVQSSLLRAAHQCRECGLIALGNTLLRIVEGCGRLRSNHKTTDTNTLRDDLASALATSLTVKTQENAPQWLIGQTRRTFDSVEMRKLHGLCAEPILTLSGYAGVCVYLQGNADDGRDLFTINELRPGDSQLVLQGYNGGIDLGNVSIDGKLLCRSALSVQNLTLSSDCRLGKGKSTRWAVQSSRPDKGCFRSGRFALPLDEQIQNVFQRSMLSESQRHGGWDLVAFDAVIHGPQGAGVVVSVDQAAVPWRLTIAIDDPQLAYRENLALLGRCPAMLMRCVGRVKLDTAGEVDLIAIAPSSADVVNEESTTEQPQMVFPPTWCGVCNVGLDRLQRHHFTGIQRWSDETNFGVDSSRPTQPSDGLDPLRRRLTGVATGGRAAIPSLGSSTHRRDERRLAHSYQSTAAQLLEVLAISAGKSQEVAQTNYNRTINNSCSLEDSYLACAVYLRSSQLHFEKQMWLRGFT